MFCLVSRFVKVSVYFCLVCVLDGVCKCIKQLFSCRIWLLLVGGLGNSFYIFVVFGRCCKGIAGMIVMDVFRYISKEAQKDF